MLHGCKYHNEKEKDKPMVYLTVTLLYGKVGYLEKITHGPPFANKEGFNSERDPKKKDNPNGLPSFNRYLASMAASSSSTYRMTLRSGQK